MHGCWSIDISKLPLMNDDIANPIVWIFLFPSLSLSLSLSLSHVGDTLYKCIDYCVCLFYVDWSIAAGSRTKIVVQLPLVCNFMAQQ